MDPEDGEWIAVNRELDIDRAQPLVLVQLSGLLVSRVRRCPSDMLPTPSGYDGSAMQLPFYVHAGAVELLRFLSNVVPCLMAVIAPLPAQTCEPMIQFLCREAGISGDQFLSFDVTSMQLHEDGLAFPSGRPKLQYDLFSLCEECESVRGRKIDVERSVLVLVDTMHLRRDQHDRTMFVPTSDGKPWDPTCQVLSSEALKVAGSVLRDILTQISLPSPLPPVKFQNTGAALLHLTAKIEKPYPIPQTPFALVAIELNTVLVYRSEVGMFAGISCDGYDGTSARRPFYIRPGAVEFLMTLAASNSCLPVVTTCMQARSCRPIIDALRQCLHLASYGMKLECFDVTVASQHEDPQVTYPSGQRWLQHNLSQICDACEDRGYRVERDRSLLVVSELRSVQARAKSCTLVLAPFAADDVVDPSRRTMVTEELHDAQEILIDALTCQTLPARLPDVPTIRKLRSFEDQQARRLNRCTSISKSELAVEVHVRGTWACADGVLADGPHVHSTAPAWAGGRSLLDSVDEGECASVSVRIHSGRTIRVGWVLSQAREVGVDQWGWGYGGTGRKVHNNDFRCYGRKFAAGDVVTSKIDRTGNLAILTFNVNGESVSEEPAFQVLQEDMACTAFFAVFGTPGFHVEMLQDDEACSQTMDKMSEGAGVSQDRSFCVGHDPIIVLSFNRHPQYFDEMLLGSCFARRMICEGVDIQPLWAYGAKIFVPHLTASDLEECRMDPCVRHVVVREEDEPEIHAILAAIPYKKRPRLKPRAPRVVIPGSSNISRFRDSSSSACDRSALSSQVPHTADYAAAGVRPTAYLPGEQVPAGSSPLRHTFIVRHTFIHVADDTPPLDGKSTKST